MKDAQKPDHVSLNTLIGRLREGRFVIPDFQREFEWKPWDIRRSHALDLSGTITLGSLLLWSGTKENFAALSCEPIYGYDGSEKPEYIVLDGQQRLMAYRGPFDGFHATEVAVSKTCLVRFDNNQYSVAARAVGRPVDVRAYADRIAIRQDGEIVAEHPRSFGRGQVAYDPWHYVPILTRKPGALRNGAPFKGWQLPNALGRLRTRLAGHDDGDRQFVKVLAAVLEDGLEAVEAACAEALDCGACSADVVLNILARQRQPAPPATIPTPEGLQLRHQPVADCQRYDSLREAGHGAS